MAPVYDKEGSSAYRRQRWLVEDGGLTYPVQRAYVKVGVNLYPYFSGKRSYLLNNIVNRGDIGISVSAGAWDGSQLILARVQSGRLATVADVLNPIRVDVDNTNVLPGQANPHAMTWTGTQLVIIGTVGNSGTWKLWLLDDISNPASAVDQGSILGTISDAPRAIAWAQNRLAILYSSGSVYILTDLSSPSSIVLQGQIPTTYSDAGMTWDDTQFLIAKSGPQPSVDDLWSMDDATVPEDAVLVRATFSSQFISSNSIIWVGNRLVFAAPGFDIYTLDPDP